MKRSYWDEKSFCPWGHPSAFEWKFSSGSDKSIFTWYQYGYGWFCSDTKFSDTTENLAEVEDKLPSLLEKLIDKGYPYSVMRYIDNGSDNQSPKMTICDIVKAWNEKYEYPKLSVSTNSMFFEKLHEDVKSFSTLKLSGDMPHTDYTILALSEAAYSVLNAGNRIRLSNAEKLYNIVGYLQNVREKTQFLPLSEFDDAWKNIMLFDEHCFGMCEVTGARFRYNRGLKMQYAQKAELSSRELENGALKTASQFMQKDDEAVTVFNPSGTKSAKSLHLFVVNLPDNCVLYDSENQTKHSVQKCYAVQRGLPYPDYEDLYCMTRINNNLSEYFLDIGEIPPLSFKTYKILQNSNEITAPEAEKSEITDDFIIQSRWYDLYISKEGKIYRITDKENVRTLSNCQRGGFASVFIKDFSASEDHELKAVSITRRLSGEVAESVLISGLLDGRIPVNEEIIVFKCEKRIDVNVSLNLTPYPTSAIWIKFPFEANMPKYSYSTPNSVVNLSVEGDIVYGANTNQITYSGWCELRDRNYKITMASPNNNVVSFGGIYPTAVSQAHHYFSEPGFEDKYTDISSNANGDIYSMLTYNNAKTNFSPYQQGRAVYSFSFRSGLDYSSETFAQSTLNPPVLFEGSSLKDMPKSPFFIDNDNITMQHFKEAADGGGYILRLYNASGETQNLGITFSRLVNVYKTDIVESAKEPLENRCRKLTGLNISSCGSLNLYIEVIPQID